MQEPPRYDQFFDFLQRKDALMSLLPSLVERWNRTCLDMLSKLNDGNPFNWDVQMPFATAAYNATPHASTGCTPNLLMFNRKTTMPIDLMYNLPRQMESRGCPNAYVEWVREQIK